MSSFSENHPQSKLRVAILVLAAGEGSRLGGYPKALLKKSGKSLLRLFCESLGPIEPTEVLVVTGFFGEQIQGEIGLINLTAKHPIHWVANPSPQEGQPSSVRIGLESLKTDYDVLLVALGDQPQIGMAEIQLLLEQFEQRTPGEEIILPIVHRQRGNPVLFSRKVIEQILREQKMVCRKYMDQYPDLIRRFSTNNEAFIRDVDTLEDILKLGLDQINNN